MNSTTRTYQTKIKVNKIRYEKVLISFSTRGYRFGEKPSEMLSSITMNIHDFFEKRRSNNQWLKNGNSYEKNKLNENRSM